MVLRTFEAGDLVIFNEKCTRDGVIGAIWEVPFYFEENKKSDLVPIKANDYTIPSLSNGSLINSVRQHPNLERFAKAENLDRYVPSNEQALGVLFE